MLGFISAIIAGIAMSIQGVFNTRLSENIGDMETIVVPVHPDNLRFIEWKENILKVNCYEFLVWGKEIELYLDIETKEWLKW